MIKVLIKRGKRPNSLHARRASLGSLIVGVGEEEEKESEKAPTGAATPGTPASAHQRSVGVLLFLHGPVEARRRGRFGSRGATPRGLATPRGPGAPAWWHVIADVAAIARACLEGGVAAAGGAAPVVKGKLISKIAAADVFRAAPQALALSPKTLTKSVATPSYLK